MTTGNYNTFWILEADIATTHPPVIRNPTAVTSRIAIQCDRKIRYRATRRTVNSPFIFCQHIQYHMTTTEIENYQQQIYKRLDIVDSPPPPPPPPVPIYDLTTSDKTELVKAAGPFERGENP